MGPVGLGSGRKILERPSVDRMRAEAWHLWTTGNGMRNPVDAGQMARAIPADRRRIMNAVVDYST